MLGVCQQEKSVNKLLHLNRFFQFLLPEFFSILSGVDIIKRVSFRGFRRTSELKEALKISWIKVLALLQQSNSSYDFLRRREEVPGANSPISEDVFP